MLAGALPEREVGSVQRVPWSNLLQVHFTGKGAETHSPLFWTCLLCGVALLPNIQNVELQRGWLGVSKMTACSPWCI